MRVETSEDMALEKKKKCKDRREDVGGGGQEAVEELVEQKLEPLKKKLAETNEKLAETKEELETVKKEVMPKPIWNVATKLPEFLVTHVIPKLNRNEIKFFYDVKRQSRALVKRAKGIKVEKAFEIRELTSLSQVKWAWEKYQDVKEEDLHGNLHEEAKGRKYEYFMGRVAESGKLSRVKWLREEKKCPWDNLTFNVAVLSGNLELVQYLFEKRCL